MKTFTIFSSETVVYRTEVKAESFEKALDLFHGIHGSELVPDSYNGFQVDSVSVEENGRMIDLDEDGCWI